MKKILIYKGEGADLYCIHAIASSLKQEGICEKYAIIQADKSLFENDHWQKDAALLIFPGGRDIPYHQALQGRANSHIRNYVLQGGKFLGLCAGGYYGCRSVEFEKGGPLEVTGERELAFFPGIARGPAYGPGQFCYRSQKGARIASLQLSASHSYAYYNGGCAFVDAESFSSISVLARYSDIERQPAAVVKCQVGKGIAILSGVHPEYSAHHEGTKRHIRGERFSALQSIEPARRQLFTHILQELSLNFFKSIRAKFQLVN